MKAVNGIGIFVLGYILIKICESGGRFGFIFSCAVDVCMMGIIIGKCASWLQKKRRIHKEPLMEESNITSIEAIKSTNENSIKLYLVSLGLYLLNPLTFIANIYGKGIGRGAFWTIFGLELSIVTKILGWILILLYVFGLHLFVIRRLPSRTTNLEYAACGGLYFAITMIFWATFLLACTNVITTHFINKLVAVLLGSLGYFIFGFFCTYLTIKIGRYFKWL